VAFVALSLDAKPDYLSEDEIELVRGGLPYLEEVWSNDDWELHEVADPAPIAPTPVRLTDTGFELDADGAGEFPIAVKFSPYYQVIEGDACVRDQGEWSVVDARAAGTIRVEADHTAGGLLDALTGSTEACD
jgi:hypothetical protein